MATNRQKKISKKELELRAMSDMELIEKVVEEAGTIALAKFAKGYGENHGTKISVLGRKLKPYQNELLRRLEEGADNKKKLQQILSLSKDIDPQQDPLN